MYVTVVTLVRRGRRHGLAPWLTGLHWSEAGDETNVEARSVRRLPTGLTTMVGIGLCGTNAIVSLSSGGGGEGDARVIGGDTRAGWQGRELEGFSIPVACDIVSTKGVKSKQRKS